MLKYKGKKIKSDGFVSGDRDLRYLEGTCKCGKVLRGIDAIPECDPYESGINEDFTEVVICEECFYNSSMNV